MTDSVRTLGDDALDAAESGLSLLYTAMNDDINADPVIRPVVDMSDVDRSASRISTLTDGEFSIGTTVQATSRAASSMRSMSLSADRQNGSGSSDSGNSYNENGVNVTGNNFYIRSDNDIKMLASELATLNRQQQRALGAAY